MTFGDGENLRPSFFAARFGRGGDSGERQLVETLGDGTPEAKKRGEHALYSSRALAGFCLMLRDGWPSHRQSAIEAAGEQQVMTRQLVLNSNGTCADCSRLPRLPEAVGVITSTLPSASAYVCTPTYGDCGVKVATWPDGTERGLPDWYVRFAQRERAARGAPGSAAAEL